MSSPAGLTIDDMARERLVSAAGTVIVLAPGMPVWAVAQLFPWMTWPVIAMTIGCALAAFAALFLVWAAAAWPAVRTGSRARVRFLMLATKAIAAVSFVPRPSIADHFQLLYPHPANTSFRLPPPGALPSP
ncbi:MAG: hypothetical protein ABJB47_14280 [Actinomycetota bacterium]